MTKYRLTYTASQVSLNGDNALEIEILLVPFKVIEYGTSDDYTGKISLETITLPLMTLGSHSHNVAGVKDLISWYLNHVQTRLSCGFYNGLVDNVELYKDGKSISRFKLK